MIDLDEICALRVQDGDLLVVPYTTETEDMHDLIDALRHVQPDARVIIIRGPVEHLDVASMNQLGWYRA
ncbi:hypothetical protein [Pseudomonas psychrophila]|uniref:hypothetical protein n=1 Tax=Pseudomonas psychrophila TaxID=122355 RepID=UPI0002EEF144|nr:hypothetical protein [Pseudomonas psychrophila]